MKTIIIYRSIMGTSQKYAKWLADEMDTKCINYKKITKRELRKCKNIVLVGPTYMSKFLLERFVKDNWGILKNKKVIFVNVGMMLIELPIKDRKWHEINDHVIKISIPGKIGALNQRHVDRRNLEKVIKAIEK